MPSAGSIAHVYRAYALMAAKAKYRPAAPGDGCGNITVPDEELDLAQEQRDYARNWFIQEDSLRYWIGCPDYPNRPAMVLAIEGVRQLCTGDGGRKPARTLLRLALKELDQAIVENGE